MPIIDAHAHVFAEFAHLAVQVMDRCGIERAVTLEWHDGFGETLSSHLEQFERFPGRFTVFGNGDWSRANAPGFGRMAAEQLARDVDRGMAGLKVYKALGLQYRREDGSLWRIDDRAFDPIWARAGALGIPVLIHCADPACFWLPEEDRIGYRGLLSGDTHWWSYYPKDTPSHASLLADRDAMIARHPETVFICPHLGSDVFDLGRASIALDALPNMVYDLSACEPFLGISPERAQATRDFVVRHQDRILFGTDIIYSLASGPKADQRPGTAQLIGEWSSECRSDLTFLQTAGVRMNRVSARTGEPYAVYGLGLPAGVLHKVLYGNVARMCPAC